MKFRIKEYNYGNKFIIQYKHKYWPFWFDLKYYMNYIYFQMNPSNNYDDLTSYFNGDPGRIHYNYDTIKASFDKVIECQLKYYKIKHDKKTKYHDVTNLNNKKDVFLKLL